MKLNENEKVVLNYLYEHCEGGEMFTPFKPVSEETGLDVKVVRRACRSLKRKGLAEYANGLSDYDGNFRGAGYSITEEGENLFSQMKLGV